jgi:hypothetical protein
MKNRFRRHMIHRPETLHATQVMDAVHRQNPTVLGGRSPAAIGSLSVFLHRWLAQERSTQTVLVRG